ncbi:MAG: hypothetical protein JRD89_20655 [Deltaproteobacteria bacterium]|nr:hypothetical protein [Deltaproteobacteria bacterium]
MTLLSNASTNPKTRKMLEEFGYEAVIHHMCPDKLADGKHTVCAWSTPGCRATCLNTSGRSQIKGDLTNDNLQMYMIHRSRMGKTLTFFDDKERYAGDLTKELANLETRALKKGYTPVARLNGTSDVPWEKYIPMEAFSNTQFYDYTKSYERMRMFLAGKLPDNYHLTYSYDEYTTPGDVNFILTLGGTVAVVFREEIPETFLGHGVKSGMYHDFRFRDSKGYIIGLLARGRAKTDSTGFVVD